MASAISAKHNNRSIGFFNQHTANTIKKQGAPVWVNVGEKEDSLFRAVAAGLIDRIISGQRLSKEALQKILAKHFTYFPHQRSKINGLGTVNERLQQLLQDISTPELVQTMAYTLRQLTVDELCAAPETYLLAFIVTNSVLAPEKMRMPEQVLHESSISALAHTLDYAIDVRNVETGKELSKRLVYQGNASNSGIVLQKQGDIYLPRLKNSEQFKWVLKKTDDLAPIDNQTSDSMVNNITTRVTRELENILTTYQGVSQRLSRMISAGDLSREQLITLYLHTISERHLQENNPKYAGVAWGTEQFFDHMNKINSVAKPIVLDPDNDAEQPLVHAIAQRLSVSRMSLETAFEALEAQETTPTASV